MLSTLSRRLVNDESQGFGKIKAWPCRSITLALPGRTQNDENSKLRQLVRRPKLQPGASRIQVQGVSLMTIFSVKIIDVEAKGSVKLTAHEGMKVKSFLYRSWRSIRGQEIWLHSPAGVEEVKQSQKTTRRVICRTQFNERRNCNRETVTWSRVL
jgi:hypothetical protein